MSSIIYSCFFLCLSLTTLLCTCFRPGHGTFFGIDLPVLQFCWFDYSYYNVSSGRVCAAFLEEPGKNHLHTYCKLCCACPTRLENIWRRIGIRVLFFLFSSGHCCDEHNGDWNTSGMTSARGSTMNCDERRIKRQTKTAIFLFLSVGATGYMIPKYHPLLTVNFFLLFFDNGYFDIDKNC